MSRNTGTFNFAANLEGLLKAPIDAKQLVGTYADLTLPATWCASGAVWLYDGAIVSVACGVDRGIYYLCDSANYTSTGSWIKVGSGSGTLTGATNGVHTSGQNVKLGGIISDATTLTLITGSSLTITDSRPVPLGMVYGSDYSLSFSSNPRSIPDVGYVNAIASGLVPKGAATVATTIGDNIDLTGGTFISGSTIDGVVITNGMRVLVKNQTLGQQNGVYNYSAASSTFYRSSDFDGTPSGETVSGNYLWVLSGNTNAQSSWVLITPNPIYIGITPLTFVLFNHVSDVIGGTGIFVSAVTGTHIVSINSAYQSEIHASLTGATNGIIKSGRTAVLGGLLTSNIVFSGNTSKYNLRYAGDYSTNYINRSLPDVGWVTGYTRSQTSGITGTITGATNGLSVTGKKIKLGGLLTGTTNIYGAQDFTFGLTIPLTSFAVLSTCAQLGAKDVLLTTTGNTAQVHLTGSTISLLGAVKLLSTPSVGTCGDSILVWDSSTCAVNKVPYLSANTNIVNVYNTTVQYTATTNNSFIGVSGTTCIFLMSNPSTGQKISIADICGCALINNIVIDAGAGKKINETQCSTINTNYGSITFIYNGHCWSAVAFTN